MAQESELDPVPHEHMQPLVHVAGHYVEVQAEKLHPKRSQDDVDTQGPVPLGENFVDDADAQERRDQLYQRVRLPHQHNQQHLVPVRQQVPKEPAEYDGQRSNAAAPVERILRPVPRDHHVSALHPDLIRDRLTRQRGPGSAPPWTVLSARRPFASAAL